MPTSSFDTFFACIIIVVAALIGTAFLSSTMQTRIINTQDINKDSYLKAIADHIINNPGTPTNWGTTSVLPVDFGLAVPLSITPYELDIDKISRLNTLNNYSLSFGQIENAAKLTNIALGIEVSQILTINILQSSNITVGSNTSFTFNVSTSIDSKPTSSTLHCYIVSHNYQSNITSTIPTTGTNQVVLQIPSSETTNALIIIFARASIDDRITSYSIYNFANSIQESTPSSANLTLSPINYTLNLNDSSPNVTIQDSYVFSYSYQQPTTPIADSKTTIPKLIDKSPLILVICGLNGTEYFQEWITYPQVPLKAGSNFSNSEQNIFSYLVIIGGVLYTLDLSFGDLPH